MNRPDPIIRTGTIRMGIGGWTYEPWRGVFYPPKHPQKRELEYASRQLASIEINGTFYGSQKLESFRAWHDQTPDDFVFSLKASRFCTNRRVLAEAGESVQRFIGSGVTELKRKLGPINWQFAPTKAFDAADFGAFLALLPQEADGLPLRHAVEVRHDSFRCEEFIDLARKHGVAIILAADSQYPQIADPTAPFIYARIMGTQEGEEHGYSPAAIKSWAKHAKEWAEGKVPKGLAYVGKPEAGTPREVFLYVISGHKVLNPAAAMEISNYI